MGLTQAAYSAQERAAYSRMAKEADQQSQHNAAMAQAEFIARMNASRAKSSDRADDVVDAEWSEIADVPLLGPPKA